MSAQPAPAPARPQPRIPIDYRQGIWKVIGTVHLGVHIAGDGGLRVVALNDGLKAMLPGLSADQAEDFGHMLIEAAAQARTLPKHPSSSEAG